ncbi:MAG: HlyD family efflux transporter periplasmic adaptor subunit, partial [Planctomycetales bacterium]|nr:HlyD family efflux transporter periplasmic adaptor subunit [Planctomycetales bacterium]
SIGGWLLSVPMIRWIVRGGGPWWFRWGLRVAFVATIVLIGFIPYSYNIGGDCRIVAADELSIRAQIADEIESVEVTEGQLVEPGQIVARLTAREETAAVNVLRAELAEAQADLNLLKAGSRPEDVEIAQQKLELWQVQFKYHTDNLGRTQQLFDDNSVTRAELEKAQKERDIAESMVDSARERVEKMEQGARQEEIDAAAARVDSAAARLAQAETMLELRNIRTSVGGRIITPKIELRKGHAVQPGDLIAVVENTGPLQAEVIADEAAAAHIEPGQLVKIRLRGRYGELLTGTVSGIAWTAEDEAELDTPAFRSDREAMLDQPNLVDGDHRYVRVYVRLDDAQDKLLPNMTGYAKVTISEGTLWEAFYRPILRFFRVDVWSWLT